MVGPRVGGIDARQDANSEGIGSNLKNGWPVACDGEGSRPLVGGTGIEYCAFHRKAVERSLQTGQRDA